MQKLHSCRTFTIIATLFIARNYYNYMSLSIWRIISNELQTSIWNSWAALEKKMERKREEKVMLNNAQTFHNVFTNFRVLLLPSIPCRLANGKEQHRNTMLWLKRTWNAREQDCPKSNAVNHFHRLDLPFCPFSSFSAFFSLPSYGATASLVARSACQEARLLPEQWRSLRK